MKDSTMKNMEYIPKNYTKEEHLFLEEKINKTSTKLH